MSKIILHMGTHKTATTYLQQVLAANRPLLGGHNIVYPTVGRFAGHHMLLSEWLPMQAGYIPDQGTQGVWDYLTETYADSDKTVVLSSEEFTRAYPKRVDMADLRARLSGFDQVQIICFLRDQQSFLQSIYLEISKDRAPQPLHEMLDIAKTDHTADGLWLDYNLLYDHFRTGFDAPEITLIPFGQAVHHPRGILGCFLELIGCNADKNAFLEQDLTVNKSSEPLAMWGANKIASPQPAPEKLVDFVYQQFVAGFGANTRSSIFTRAEVGALAAIFNPLNQQLATRIKTHQPHFSAPQIAVNETHIHRGQLDGPFWINLLRNLYRNPL